MYQYKIEFLALTDTVAFEIKSQSKEIVEEFVEDMLLIFARVDENEKIVVESLQKNSSEIKEKIEIFTDKYKSKLPQLNGIPAYFRKLKENEQFFFLPNIKSDTIDNLKLYDYLRATEKGKSFEEIHKQTTDLFGELLKKYQIKVYGDKRISIGEPIKSKRLCRFCNNERPNISFNNKAHAISEGLGNKTLILFDECDVCNSDFSKNVEQDLIQYLALFRTIFDVKGKGGSKKFDGQNFNLKNENKVILTFNGDGERPESFSMPYKVKLQTRDPITLQNIYKSLCKYFLSVIDNEYLPAFKKTIDWINGKIQIENLPKIGEMISYHSFSMQPRIATYIRIIDDKSFPFAVGELYFTCILFVFIIPLSDRDDRNFTDKIDFENYWRTFQHYKKTKGWGFRDYSNNKPREFIINLNFEMNDK